MSPSATLGFNGEAHEPGTRWQLLGNGYRAYNPVLMKFHSPDSMSPLGRGGINAYAYCGNDAVNRFDPSGHFMQYLPTLLLGAGAAGAIVGAVVAEDTSAKVGSAAAAAALLIAAVGVFSMTQPTLRAWMSGEFVRPSPPRPRAPSESLSALEQRLLEGQRNMLGYDYNDWRHFMRQRPIVGGAPPQAAPAPVRLPGRGSSRSILGLPESGALPPPDIVSSHVPRPSARHDGVSRSNSVSSTASSSAEIRGRALSIGSHTLTLRDLGL